MNTIVKGMKIYFFSVIFTLFSSVLIAQSNDPVIMKVNGKGICKSEFEYIYQKNNNEGAIDKKSLQEYIELFKNFKLKVAEAEAQGIDTTASFHEELENYRSQLAKPYLSDIKIDESLIQKEYNRMKEDVEISHILISYSGGEKNVQQALTNTMLPADTLKAYNKAMAIRKRLMKGEDFGKVAKEASDDKQSSEKDTPGYLGWFSALSLMPTLENAAYDTPVGQVSMPVRTFYGYHLVKVLHRQQDPGQINVAHILVACPKNSEPLQVTEAQKKTDDIYAQALRGEDFSELAKKYSDDKGSATNGGDLSWFGFGSMVKEFQDAAFSLKNVGDISKPIQSQFGFHIIKLLGKRPIASYEEMKGQIKDQIERGGEYMALLKPQMEMLKKDNKFSLNETAFKELQVAANTMYPADSAFVAKFGNNRTTLFSANGTNYTINQFINFLQQEGNRSEALSTDFLNNRLLAFQFDCLMNEEDKSLETKYPEFKNLMQEYRDGILLFEVSNREVWDKASKDTKGLEAFFEQNKANYTWDTPHYKGYIVLCKDSKNKKKMMKETSKMNPDSAANYLIKNYRIGDVSYVKIEKGLFVQGDNEFIDEAIFKTGKKVTCPKEFQDFFVTGKLLTDAPQDYTDVKGLVITDYQNYLEKRWIDSLQKKYPVIIYNDVANTIK